MQTGDSYFADHVFHLTDKQKELAKNYAENLTAFFGTASSGIVAAINLSDEVLSYRPAVERAAAKYGMSDYVDLILAVMMQESGGRGLDVMQAAEGGFNTRYPHVPNGITDPEYSIECGIQELKYALDKAGCTGPTDLDRIKLALQGYNYGSAYIDWAMERDGGYTKENAIAYSDMMCARPSWPYDRYGDKEYVDHVLRYYQITASGGSYPANGMQIPHYLQTDYGNIPYGGGSIASSGCGPTSFAMIASYLTGTTITPIDAISWCGNSYYKPGVGTYWSYFQAASDHFGCGAVTQTSDPNQVLQALSEGHPVISSQRAGLFTSGGHFIVLRGVTAGGKVLVNDPNDSLDISELTGSSDLLTVGMFVALDYVWDKAKENRTEEKAIFVDEVWQLIGASSNRLAAEFVLEIAKIIRAYSGAGIFATQDLNDFFALDDGKYGKGIINNCKTKIILNMEDEEAQRVKTILRLSETEVMNITHPSASGYYHCSHN